MDPELDSIISFLNNGRPVSLRGNRSVTPKSVIEAPTFSTATDTVEANQVKKRKIKDEKIKPLIGVGKKVCEDDTFLPKIRLDQIEKQSQSYRNENEEKFKKKMGISEIKEEENKENKLKTRDTTFNMLTHGNFHIKNKKNDKIPFKTLEEFNCNQLKPLKMSNTKLLSKYLFFRPFLADTPPSKPIDRGYYYKFNNSDVKLIRYTLEDNGFIESNQSNKDNWSLMWSSCALKSQVYGTLNRYQRINHFPKTSLITRKDSLCNSVGSMQSIHDLGNRHFNFIPKTYILPNEAQSLCEEMDANPDQWWIIKPSASSQGKGIFFTNNFSEIPIKQNMIASHYINNPLLINGLKFDLRIYVAITSINPLRIYIYDEGLARFATTKYTSQNSHNKNDRFMHLTNYSVNKFSSKFVANTDAEKDGVGNKWSMTALKEALKRNMVDVDKMWRKIEDIVIKTILSAEPILKSAYEMYVPHRNNCFELLGFDVMIDDNNEPWLLEVNLSPSMNIDSPLDQKIKSELIADLFSLAGTFCIVPLDLRKECDDTRYKKLGIYANNSLNDSAKKSSNKDRSFTAKSSGNKKSYTEFIKGIEKLHKRELGKEERLVIKETDDEVRRKGKFKRIFPSVNYGYYKQFFEHERELNSLLNLCCIYKANYSGMKLINERKIQSFTYGKARSDVTNKPSLKTTS